MDDLHEPDPFLSSSDSGRGGMPVFVPIGLAIIGIALGGVAIAMSLSSGDESQLQERLAASADRAATLEQRISELNAQNEKLRHDFDNLGKRVNAIPGQTQDALNDVGKEIISTNSNVAKNTAAIKNMVETLNSGQVRRTAPSTPTATASATSATDRSGYADAGTASESSAAFVPGGVRSHVIAEGDTFSSVAKQYGVPLHKVLEANPDVDAKRMRIGQKISIPHHQP